MIIEEANTRYINCYMHTMNTYSRRTSWSENMSTRGEELPNASIKLEDGTLARKGCLFSFQNYEGDEDNSLYLAAITDKGYLKFLTEGQLFPPQNLSRVVVVLAKKLITGF